MKVLILGNSSLSSRLVMEQLNKLENVNIDYLIYPKFTDGRKDVKNFRRWGHNGKKFLFLKIFSFFVDPLLSYLFHRNITRNLKKSGVSHIRIFRDIDSKLATIANKDYSLVVSIGHRILKSSFFKATNEPILNLHCGRLPQYGGIANEFWVRFYDEKEMVVTLHQMTEKLDNGFIVMEKSIEINKSWSIFMTNINLCIDAGSMLNEFLQDFSKSKLINYAQNSYEPVIRSFPEKSQLRELRKKGIGLFHFSDLKRIYGKSY